MSVKVMIIDSGAVTDPAGMKTAESVLKPLSQVKTCVQMSNY